MITLDVYFTENEYSNGTACLIENLITNTVRLDLTGNLYLDEIKAFIDKAVNLLKTRYETINVNVKWDSLLIKEGKNNDTITNK